LIRTDHIGRPVLATDSTGTVVWTASYDPFGTVQASTGTPAAIRFPGQWFQGIYFASSSRDFHAKN
jgi:uncharacterized protein RhaS with RHS repeats